MQACLLAFATIVAYRYAFLDVARADQLVYLYRTSDVRGLWNLTIKAYDFNRAAGPSRAILFRDFVLFRPVLYILLGMERWLWGYHFFAWQATSIAVHIATTLSLFAYFRYVCHRGGGPERPAVAPFVFAAYFASVYVGTEMVAWHHVVGYSFFCFLLVQALFAYQRFLDRRAWRDAALLACASGLACFTYELGNILAGLLGLALAASFISERGAGESLSPRERFRAAGLAAVLLALPVLYAAWSYVDFMKASGLMSYRFPPFTLFRLAWNAALAMRFWSIAVLVPSAVRLSVGGRIGVEPFFVLDTSSLAGVGVASVLALCALALSLSAGRRFDRLRDGWAASILLLLAFGYALIIAAGRGLERGLSRGVLNNGYYPYIFALLGLAAFFHLIIAPSVHASGSYNALLRRILYAAAVCISIVGWARIYAIHRAMYHAYSGPMSDLIGRIEEIRERHGQEPDFSFSMASDCRSDFILPWLAPYIREKHERYTPATALFNNESRDKGGKYIVDCSSPQRG